MADQNVLEKKFIAAQPWLEAVEAEQIWLPGAGRLDIRPARPEDAVLLVEMHARLSSQSIYSRYLHPYQPCLEEIQRLISIKEDEGAVLVAVLPGDRDLVVAMAHYAAVPGQPGVVEPAILVEDAFQGMGVGQALGRSLNRIAAAQGVRVMRCYIDPQNFRMLRMIQSSGLPVVRRFVDGVVEASIWLDLSFAPQNSV